MKTRQRYNPEMLKSDSLVVDFGKDTELQETVADNVQDGFIAATE